MLLQTFLVIPKLVTTLEICNSLRKTDELATVAWFSTEPSTVQFYKPVHKIQTHTRQGRRTVHWILTGWQLQCQKRASLHHTCTLCLLMKWSAVQKGHWYGLSMHPPRRVSHEIMNGTVHQPSSQVSNRTIPGRGNGWRKKYHSVSQSNMSQVSDGMTGGGEREESITKKQDIIPVQNILSQVLDGTTIGKNKTQYKLYVGPGIVPSCRWNKREGKGENQTVCLGLISARPKV